MKAKTKAKLMIDYKERPYFYDKEKKLQNVPYYAIALFATYAVLHALFFALETTSNF